MQKKPLVILTGPTAVGKTALSIGLAKAIHGEIISADSMQVYRKMNIGTAKITPEEMQGVPHFLVDVLDPDEAFDVALFQKMAKEAMEDIYSRGKIPIIVGGTGFYIQAVLYDIDFSENASGVQNGKKNDCENNNDKDAEIVTVEEKNKQHTLREELAEYEKMYGAQALHKKLEEVDEEAAKQIHPNNVKRVIRAIEYFHETGKKISEHNAEQKEKVSPYNYAYFVLNDDRQVLYDRIDKRVDLMFEQGLVEEVRSLYDQGYTKELTSMQAIGYKEIVEAFETDHDFERAKEQIQLDTRHLAKRQLTWFRREKCVDWMDYAIYGHDKKRMLEDMIGILKERNIIE